MYITTRKENYEEVEAFVLLLMEKEKNNTVTLSGKIEKNRIKAKNKLPWDLHIATG